MKHPIDWIAHFFLTATIAFFFSVKDSIVVSLTIEATQLDACWNAKVQPDVEDTIIDLVANGIGIAFGSWLRGKIVKENAPVVAHKTQSMIHKKQSKIKIGISNGRF